MKKILTIALLMLACTLPATAQNWSIGVRSGAFVFGNFIERRVQPAVDAWDVGAQAEANTLALTAETAPGLAVDLERRLADRWAVRVEGTFTRAPLAVRDESDEEGDIRSGDLDVATFSLPLIFRINTGGAFRFHIYGGPAFAIYRFEPPDRPNAINFPETTRSEWGVEAGAGVTWHVSERFGVEGAISDVATTSPFDREDLAPVPGIKIPRPHNVHTTVGVRYRF